MYCQGPVLWLELFRYDSFLFPSGMKNVHLRTSLSPETLCLETHSEIIARYAVGMAGVNLVVA